MRHLLILKIIKNRAQPALRGSSSEEAARRRWLCWAHRECPAGHGGPGALGACGSQRPPGQASWCSPSTGDGRQPPLRPGAKPTPSPPQAQSGRLAKWKRHLQPHGQVGRSLRPPCPHEKRETRCSLKAPVSQCAGRGEAAPRPAVAPRLLGCLEGTPKGSLLSRRRLPGRGAPAAPGFRLGAVGTSRSGRLGCGLHRGGQRSTAPAPPLPEAVAGQVLSDGRAGPATTRPGSGACPSSAWPSPGRRRT